MVPVTWYCRVHRQTALERRLDGSHGRPDRADRVSRALRTLLHRLLHLGLVIVAVSSLTSLMIELIPGDPALSILGEAATPDQIAAVNQTLGLDQPFLVRFGQWLGNAVRGDLGTSFRTGQQISDAISSRVPVSLELAVLSLLVALLVAVPVAIYAAYREGGRADRLANAAASTLISTPSFLAAIVLLFLFAVTWQVFPVTGWVAFSQDPLANLQHALLPVAALAASEVAVFLRLLRSDMIATLREDFVLAARATGLPMRRVLLQHALRPSSFSLVTLAGLSLGRLIGGTVIVETIFAIPGLGQYMISSILNKDVLAVQGTVLFIAVGYVLINALVDLSYQWLDPRVKATAGARA